MHSFYRPSCYLYSHKFGCLLTRHRQKDLVTERFIPLIPQVALHLLVWAHQPKREWRSSYTSAPLVICLHLHVTHGVPLRRAKKTFYQESHVPVKQQRGSVAVRGNEYNSGQISGAISIFVPSEHIKKAALSHLSLVELRGDRGEWDVGGGGWAEEVVPRVVGGWMKRGATCRN